MKLPWNNTTANILGIGGVVGLAFTVWFAITGVVAEEEEAREQGDWQLIERFKGLELQDNADDVDFEIYKVAKQMDEIGLRQANKAPYHGDTQRLKGLQRQLDILLNRQLKVLDRLEANSSETK